MSTGAVSKPGAGRGWGAADTAAALAIVSLAVSFWKLKIIDSASEKAIFYTNDLFAYIYPMYKYGFDALKGGRVPLWNPHQFCGEPFLATFQVGIWYPLNFLYLVFDTALAIEVVTFVHLALAGLFMYLYGRTIRLGRAASVFSAISFMLGGYLTRFSMSHPHILAAAVWLPLMLLGVEKLVANRSCRCVSFLCLVIAMPILAGRMQIWTYAMYVFCAYAVYNLVLVWIDCRQPEATARFAGCLAAALLMGVALAAVQWLPTAELTWLSSRAPGGLDTKRMFVGGVFPPEAFFSRLFDSRTGFPREAYVGIAPLVLSLWALFSGEQRRRVIFFLCLAVVAVLLSLGPHTPLFKYFLLLPTADWFRQPHRILYLFSFSVSVLGGIGFQFLQSLVGGKRPRRAAFTLALVTGVAMACVYVMGAYQQALQYALIILAAMWVALFVRARQAAPALLYVVIALLAWDLFSASENQGLRPYHGLTAYWRERTTFQYIYRQQGFERAYVYRPPSKLAVFDYAITPKQGMMNGLFSISDYEPLNLKRYVEDFYPLLVESTSAEERSSFTGYLKVAPTDRSRRLLNMMSVRFLAIRKLLVGFNPELRRFAQGLKTLFRSTGIIVYVNGDALPRAYIVHASRVIRDQREILEELASHSFDPKRTVILEEEVEAMSSTATPAGLSPGEEQVQIVGYSAEEVSLQADIAADGYLVLTDTFYPGWKVYVDNEPSRIYRANYLFRAVPLTAGLHTVRFVYDPLSFKIGAAVTLAVLAIMMFQCLLPLSKAISRWGSQLRTRARPQ